MKKILILLLVASLNMNANNYVPLIYQKVTATCEGNRIEPILNYNAKFMGFEITNTPESKDGISYYNRISIFDENYNLVCNVSCNSDERFMSFNYVTTDNSGQLIANMYTPHRRQGHRRRGREGDVVEAHQHDLLRHPHPAVLHQRLEDAERHQVVGREDRVGAVARRAGEDPVAGRGPLRDGHRRRRNHLDLHPDDDDQTSFDKTAALLQTYPELKGIVSPTTVGIAAAARYLSTSDYKGKVMLTGLGTPNQMREYVEDGTVEAFALWNPADLGYLAAFAAQALVNGDITGAEGDEFEAGKLGSYTVGEGASVLLGEPYVFDAENIADFDF